MKYQYQEKHYPKLNCGSYNPQTDSGFDASERWEISFYLFYPSLQKVVRERDKSFNYIKTAKARYKAALKKMEIFRAWLDAGMVKDEAQQQYAESTLIDALQKALEFKKDLITPGNYQAYISNLKVLSEWLKENKRDKTLLTQTDYKLFNDFFEYLRKVRKVSNHTYNNYILHLKSLLNFFVKNEKILTANPLEVRKIKALSGVTHKPFTDEQIKAIKQAIADKAQTLPHYQHLANYIAFVYHLAIRSTELKLLRVCDIGQELVIIRAENAKSRRTDHVIINPYLREILLEMKIYELAKDPKKQNWFIFGENGEISPTQHNELYFYRMHKRILRKVGLWGQGYTIYAYKHTKGCHLVAAGASLEDIRVFFRHEDLAITAKYLRQIGAIIPGNLKDKSRAL